MASPVIAAFAAAALSLAAGSAMACPDLAACGGMSAHYGYYTEQASFGPLVEGGDDQAPGPDVYGAQEGPDYGPDEQGPPPAYGPPPPADPRYGPPPAGYRESDQGGEAYESRGFATASRTSQASVSEYGYDSGWQRAPAPAAGHAVHGGRSYAEMSISERNYDSGWREQRGRSEVLCPPGSAYQRPDPRYGCPLAAGNPVPVPDSFFYDTGGAGPAFVGSGGGGGAVIFSGGARAGGFAFASARASASVHIGGHFHGGGGHGHGCGCGHGGHH